MKKVLKFVIIVWALCGAWSYTVKQAKILEKGGQIER